MDKKLNVHELYQEMNKIEMEPPMQGWIAEHEGEILRQEAEKLKDNQLYLEIGVAFGKSLATVAYYTKTQAEIYGIDLLDWKEPRTRVLKQFGVDKRINFIKGDSQQEALKWKKPIDLLFIDGNHEYYHVVMDLLSWVPHVRSGGTILLHDYHETSPGVMKAVHDFVFPHGAYTEFTQPEEEQFTIYRFTKV